MSEKPIERLNYVNGQRLEASDFRLEQEYHIRVRRWLNRSLYSPGIAQGLSVRAERQDDVAAGRKPGPRVFVSPGLALDAGGHEIILWDQVPVTVEGYRHAPPGAAGVEEGIYLTIRYNEEVTAVQTNGCSVPGARASACESRPAWGGPTRVRAEPLFAWRDFVPAENSGEIVLARIVLDGMCQAVAEVDAAPRRYVSEGTGTKVRQYALEGEREIASIPRTLFAAPQPSKDVTHDASIYFHIRGRQPRSVTLYLRSEQMSPLRYTEVGLHKHGAQITGSVQAHVLDSTHNHALVDENGEKLATDLDLQEELVDIVDGEEFRRSQHHHWITAKIGDLGVNTNKNLYKFVLDGDDNSNPRTRPQMIDNDVMLQVWGGEHRHRMNGPTARGGFGSQDQPPFHYSHTHDALGLSGAVDDGGVLGDRLQGTVGRGGAPMSFVTNLRVLVDGIDRSEEILKQLASAGSADWQNRTQLGDGGIANDVLKEKGTGAIRLDLLPNTPFGEGEHTITLHLLPATDGAGNAAANGGRILYNLYIE